MSTLVQKAPALRDDNRGAIMVVGMFMACAMVGMMWMLVGLGDAVLWRDRSQEAADAIAFSSASVHARGMNLIAFMNIVMVLLTAVYMVLAFLYNVTDFILVLTGRNDKGPYNQNWLCSIFDYCQCDFHSDEIDLLAVATEGALAPLAEFGSYFCSIAGATQPLHDKFRDALNFWKDNVMSPVMPALATAQVEVAVYAPMGATVVSSLVGYKYTDWENAAGGPTHHYGTAMSPSLTQGTGFNTSRAPGVISRPTLPDVKTWKVNGQEFEGGSADHRIGLPVEEKEMTDLCPVVADKVKSALKAIPLAGDFLALVMGVVPDSAYQKAWCKNDDKGLFNPFDTILYGIFLGSGPKPDHNIYHWDVSGKGPFWESEEVGGPKTVVEYAQNGNDWMQVYAVTFGANRLEQSEKPVAVASMNWGASQNSNLDLLNMYVAQGEFYFDCSAKWEDDSCNGSDNAMYALSWRTRLRRVHVASWGSSLFGKYTSSTFGDGFDSAAKTWVSDTSAYQAVQKVLGKSLSSTLLDKSYGWLKDKGTDYVGGMLNSNALVPNMVH